MSELGAVFYRGPSLLTGEPIFGALTGLEGGSLNPKTGPMVQAYVMRSDLPPMDAKRSNVDDAVCGDCKLRGRDGKNSGCYVTVWNAPNNVFRTFTRGEYFDASRRSDLAALVEARAVRIAAYGDPAAIPFEVWIAMLEAAGGWVAYTHAWRTCDPRLRAFCMASVDDEAEFVAAQRLGWRTYRIRMPGTPLLLAADSWTRKAEFACPASDEAGHRTTCQRCQLCRGLSSPARSVAIVAHGKPSTLRVFGIRRPFFESRAV